MTNARARVPARTLAKCQRCNLYVSASRTARLCRACLLRRPEKVAVYLDGFAEWDCPPRGWLELGLPVTTRLPRLRWDNCTFCTDPAEPVQEQCPRCLMRFMSHPVRQRMQRRMADMERLTTGVHPMRRAAAIARLSSWTDWQERFHAGITSPLPVASQRPSHAD